MTDKPDAAEAPPPLAETVQAHLGRASSFAQGDTRNWSMFFFFRILTQAEVVEDFRRLGDLMKADAASIRKAGVESGMVTLRHDGARKVMLGMTTPEEVMMVTAESE